MKRNLTPTIIIQILLFVVLVAVDQLTKYLVVLNLKGQEPIVLIPKVLELRYLENRGAAFSMFQNRQWLFYIITAVVMIVIIVLWSRVVLSLKQYALLEDEFKEKTFKNGKFLNYILVILAAGAIGNLIDRIRFQYVVDFVYIKLIDFPIFNFADICVSLAAVLLVVYFIFIHKEDKNFVIFSKNKSDSAK